MPDPWKLSRRIRRQVDREGVHLNLAADVNVVASGGAGGSSRQHVSVRQRRGRSAPPPDTTREEQT